MTSFQLPVVLAHIRPESLSHGSSRKVRAGFDEVCGGSRMTQSRANLLFLIKSAGFAGANAPASGPAGRTRNDPLLWVRGSSTAREPDQPGFRLL